MANSSRREIPRGSDTLALDVYDRDSDTLVLVLPAMGTPASYYGRLAASLGDAGMASAVLDLRGVGESAPRPSRASRYGYADLSGDVGAALEALADLRRGRRTLLLGHSLGGQLAISQPFDVDGIVLVAAGVPYWRTYRGVAGPRILALSQYIGVLSRLLGVWPGWGFGGRQAAGVMTDWAWSARRGRLVAPLTIDVTAPVLVVSVQGDTYVPRATSDYTAALITTAPVTRARLTASEAGVELDHFRWVKAGAAVAGHINGWLSQQASSI